MGIVGNAGPTGAPGLPDKTPPAMIGGKVRVTAPEALLTTTRRSYAVPGVRLLRTIVALEFSGEADTLTGRLEAP